jgi:hypothetical protein
LTKDPGAHIDHRALTGRDTEKRFVEPDNELPALNPRLCRHRIRMSSDLHVALKRLAAKSVIISCGASETGFDGVRAGETHRGPGELTDC